MKERVWVGRMGGVGGDGVYGMDIKKAAASVFTLAAADTLLINVFFKR